MGRGKIDIKRIEKSSSRQVTFSKRRVGLVKKAQELSILCDAEVGLVIFSSAGKLFEFASSSMVTIIERYIKCAVEQEALNHQNKASADCREEIKGLSVQAGNLESTIRKHVVDEDIQNLNLQELHQLEKEMSMGLSRVRAQKDHLLLQQIEDLDKKGMQLQAENKDIQAKITKVHELIEQTKNIEAPSTIAPLLIQAMQNDQLLSKAKRVVLLSCLRCDINS